MIYMKTDTQSASNQRNKITFELINHGIKDDLKNWHSNFEMANGGKK